MEALAATSDVHPEEMTQPEALASDLAVDTWTVERHLAACAACELAHCDADGRVRVTVTGKELLALDIDEAVIVASGGSHEEA